MSKDDLSAILLTLKLATVVTLILLVITPPLAWWLARTRHMLKPVVLAVCALPLVLPPTVIGFYLLISLGPKGFIGGVSEALNLGRLAFSFSGLVLASLIYSLPFVLQPIYSAMQGLGTRPLEVASTLRAGPIDQFFNIVIPSCKPAFISAAIMGFAHTIGEFGVVLMIGGNIPGETQVISVRLYEHVEALDYSEAHRLAAGLLLFSFIVLFSLYRMQHNPSIIMTKSRS